MSAALAYRPTGQPEYRVTFPERFRDQPHPHYGRADPEGWVAIEAPNLEVARYEAVRLFGSAWAFVFAPGQYDQSYWPDLYPAGEIERTNALLVAIDATCPVCGFPERWGTWPLSEGPEVIFGCRKCGHTSGERDR